jgi:hypothetical protein
MSGATTASRVDTATTQPPTPSSNEVNQTVLESLVKRATTDTEFRALALRDPAAAFAAVAGKPLPTDYRLRIVENDHAQLSLVLPEVQDGAAETPVDRKAFSLSLEWSEAEADAATQALLNRARHDRAFRTRAIADPRAAVEELTGKPLPEGFTVHLIDNAHATTTLILPDVAEPRTELSEAELGAVAGGSKKGWKAFWSGFSADFVLVTGGDFIGQAKGCLK